MTTATKAHRAAAPPPRRPRANVRVIGRAVDILACFTETRESLTLRDIAARTGIQKTTAFRILATLVADGILAQSEGGAPYELGFFALRCADAILGADPLRQCTLPIMTRLRDELNETVVLAERRGLFAFNLDKAVSRQGIVETPTIGVSTLLHETPAGLAILSTFDTLAEYFAAAEPSPTAAQQRAIIERIRAAKAQGAIFIQSDRQSPTVAAPIMDSAGKGVAALSITIPSGRAEPRLIQRCLVKLTKAVQQLRMG